MLNKCVNVLCVALNLFFELGKLTIGMIIFSCFDISCFKN